MLSYLIIKIKMQKLKPREQEIFELIMAEYTDIEIAGKLNISIRTVEPHKINNVRK